MPEHDCIQQVAINDIKNSVANIETGIKQQNERITKALDLLFGEDMEGGLITKIKIHTQSLGRLWYFVGFVALVFLSTGIKVWFF